MITSNISYAVNALNQGELVAIPTETVYGLAGSAFNEHAIDKIFQLKNRPSLFLLNIFLSVINLVVILVIC